MKHIIIYGGSFDPPTIAHQKIVEKLKELNNFDEIWIQPTYFSQKKLSSANIRLEMCHIAFTGKNIKISDYEIKNQLQVGTYDVISKMIKDFVECKFTFVIGSDNANTIDQWENGSSLISMIPFIVFTRDTNRNLDVWYTKSPHQLIELEFTDISSTKFRKDKDLNIVDPKIFKYTQTKNLYN